VRVAKSHEGSPHSSPSQKPRYGVSRKNFGGAVFSGFCGVSVESRRRKDVTWGFQKRGSVVECGGKPWRDTAVASRTVFSGLFTFFTRSTAVSPMRGSAFASLPPHSTTLPRLVMRFSQFGTQCVPNFGHSVSKIYSPLNV
jgi:hypothetical protein